VGVLALPALREKVGQYRVASTVLLWEAAPRLKIPSLDAKPRDRSDAPESLKSYPSEWG
jgi:hypothetical protein